MFASASMCILELICWGFMWTLKKPSQSISLTHPNTHPFWNMNHYNVHYHLKTDGFPWQKEHSESVCICAELKYCLFHLGPNLHWLPKKSTDYSEYCHIGSIKNLYTKLAMKLNTQEKNSSIKILLLILKII